MCMIAGVEMFQHAVEHAKDSVLEDGGSFQCVAVSVSPYVRHDAWSAVCTLLWSILIISELT